MNRIAVFALTLFVGCGRQPSERPYDPEVVAARPDANNPAGENLEFPPGWKYRLDVADPNMVVGSDTATSDIWFVTMTPGWHVTTKRPRAILYHPAITASGSFTASSKIHLMYPGDRNEAYGLFFGGNNLESDAQSYLYFLIRRSGEFLVKRRLGDGTETLKDWTAHEVIVPYDNSTEVIATNTLAVSVDETSITYMVNDAVVHTMEKGDLNTDGIIGLRYNHGIDSHVETLDVVRAE